MKKHARDLLNTDGEHKAKSKQGRRRKGYKRVATGVEYAADGAPLRYKDADGTWHSF